MDVLTTAALTALFIIIFQVVLTIIALCILLSNRDDS